LLMFEVSEENIRAIAQAIERATGISLYPDLPPIKEWLAPIRELSDRFNRLKSETDMYRGSQLEEAYCLYFFPVNVIRVLYVLSQLISEHGDYLRSILSRPALTVWDIGCGPGTASFAFSLLVRDRSTSPSYVLMDSNARMLSLAEKVLFPASAQTHPLSLNAGSFPDGPAPDVVFVVNVINETSGDGARKSLDHIIDRLADEGLLVLMEPALRKHSRKLLEVRNYLLDAHSSQVSLIYPCTHAHPCPILKDPENWCYMSCTWDRPEWITVFDRHLGLNKRELDFTPIVFRKTTAQGPSAGDSRVVSDMTSRKWGWECFLCSQSGLQRTVLRNKAAKKLCRGDVVSQYNLTILKG